MGDLKVALEVEITDSSPVRASNDEQGCAKRKEIESCSPTPNKKTKLSQDTPAQEESETSKELISEDSKSSEAAPASKTTDNNTPSKTAKARFCQNKKNDILRGMTAVELRKILDTDCFQFCQEMGIFAKSVKCTCNKDMRLCKATKSYKAHWICKRGHAAKMSVRKGSWLEGSRHEDSAILFIAYMWVHEYSFKSMLHESGVLIRVLNEWLKSCVDLCQAILETKDNPIGGENTTVELFECRLKREKWIFCALELNSSNSVMIFVEDMKSDTVTQLLCKYLLPGTTVVSRVWRAYDDMTSNDFNYLTKEKSLTFFDLVTQIKMDTHKEFEKKTSRSRPNLEERLEYDDQFFEKMYRKSLAFADDAYIAFLKDVSLVKKPWCVYIKNEKVED